MHTDDLNEEVVVEVKVRVLCDFLVRYPDELLSPVVGTSEHQCEQAVTLNRLALGSSSCILITATRCAHLSLSGVDR